jgi:hypothetical protein
MSRKSSKRRAVSSRTVRMKASEMPPWLLAKIEDHEARWKAGKCRTCMHAPSPTNGIQACMVAWKPDLVTCPGCSVLAVVGRGSQENLRCDRCARIVADTPDDHLYSAIARLRGMAYAYAWCTTCRVNAA